MSSNSLDDLSSPSKNLLFEFQETDSIEPEKPKPVVQALDSY